MAFRNALLLTGVLVFSLIGGSSATGQCIINFDVGCPNASPQCDASFTGGTGCILAGLGNCYDTGSRAYQLGSSTPVTVVLSIPIQAIDVFFAHSGGGSTSGTMRFFSADSTEIGTAFTTNGDCGGGTMPPTQSQAFGTPVTRIEATITGTGSGWIDTMELTSVSVPVELITWGRLKAATFR